MRYYIRYEPMGGEWFYMIYLRVLCFHAFVERCNEPEAAKTRLAELNHA